VSITEGRTVCITRATELVQVDAEMMHALGRMRNGAALTAGPYIFSFPQRNPEAQAESGVHSASYPMDTSGSFPGVKWPGRETIRAIPHTCLCSHE
jgi:hypothetical protein